MQFIMLTVLILIFTFTFFMWFLSLITPYANALYYHIMDGFVTLIKISLTAIIILIFFIILKFIFKFKKKINKNKIWNGDIDTLKSRNESQ